MLGTADLFKAVGHEVRGGPPSQTLLLMYSGAWDNSQRRQWHPTPVFLPGKSHGWKSLVGYSPWGSKESDTTERIYSLKAFPVPTEFQISLRIVL